MAGRVVHCKREPYDIYIGRPSILGNPYSHRTSKHPVRHLATREDAIAAFREYAVKRMVEDQEFAAAIRSCRGKVLGCWCAPQPCHGEIILELADGLFNLPQRL